MTSVDPKSKDSWLDLKRNPYNQKVEMVRRKRQQQEKNEEEEKYDAQNQKHVYDTLYRQSYNRRDKKQEEQLEKQRQLIRLNHRYMISKTNNNNIPIVEQIQNKKQMVQQLQSEIDKDKQIYPVYQKSKEKLNNDILVQQKFANSASNFRNLMNGQDYQNM